MAFKCPAQPLWELWAENGGFYQATAQSGPVTPEQSLGLILVGGGVYLDACSGLKLPAGMIFTVIPAEFWF